MTGAGGAPRAVIIDSWPMIRIGLSRVLQSGAVRTVGETDDPAEGLALARAEGADLLLIGHQPRAAALTIREAKTASPGPAVAVLVGQAAPEDLAELLASGADGLLVQSIGPDELLDAVARLLAGERVVSPGLLPSLVGIIGVSGDHDGRPAAQLTAKERQVLAGLADGRSNLEIAAALFLSAATVKTHLSHIYTKLGVRSRHEAVARAVSLGLLG